MERLRPVLYAIGFLLTLLSGAMAIPGLVDAFMGSPDWETFAASSFITAFVGVALILTNRCATPNLSLKQAFLLTTSSWAVMTAFAALPFALADMDLSYADAYFEAMSGLTTTGSTVIVGLDHAPPGILLWRALLQGLGGVGIIVMAIIVLPMLKIGGMQLFRTESSDRTDKIMPRVSQISRAILLAYCLLTALCTFALYLAGMSFFDAICHAMPAISTGGFSNYDVSVAYFNSPSIELILVVFMLLGGMPFLHFVQCIKGNPTPLLQDRQVRWYLAIVASATIAIALWAYEMNGLPFWDALRHSLFSVTSIVTTTGFVSADYSVWGGFVVVSIFVLTVVGACTGSTAGGIKTFRLMVLYQIAKTQVHQLFQPHAIIRPTFNGKPIGDSDIASVMGFIVLWGVTFSVLAVLLSLTGLDFITSMSSVATAMGNTGPGLGPIVGPAGNFATIPDAAKWLLSFAMLVGRLELFSVFVLLAPRFWRS